MKSISQFILESIDNHNSLKKLFKPYKIKIGSYGVTNGQFINRNAEYKNGNTNYYFEINANFKDNVFNISVNNYFNKNSEIYNFVDGKWEIDKINEIHKDDKNLIKTKFDDMSTAFSEENFDVLLGYIGKFREDNFPKEDEEKLKKEMDERLQKVTPKIISLIEKEKNGRSLSYDEFIEYLTNIDDSINKRNQTKIKKNLSAYQSNDFTNIDSDDLYDLIIYDGWYPEIDSSIIKYIKIDEERCITIHKYDNYTIAMIGIDLDRPEIYVIE